MLSSYGQSDAGRHRDHNEDSILVGEDLFLVCDGMGGHRAGEVASKIAVETIARFRAHSQDEDGITWPFGMDSGLTRDGNRLKMAIKLANAAIVKAASASSEYDGMGTTVAAVLALPNEARIEWATVGDSRIYRMRNGAFAKLSRDDSWAEAVFGAEPHDDAALGGMRHALTKAVGLRDRLEFEVHSEELLDGDTLLLCSDGLTNMVPDEEMQAILAKHGADLPAAGKALIAAANLAGGQDNISAVLIRYRR
jgi:PPM family protein phosphatase